MAINIYSFVRIMHNTVIFLRYTDKRKDFKKYQNVVIVTYTAPKISVLLTQEPAIGLAVYWFI
jgi:hypothetical protein